MSETEHHSYEQHSSFNDSHNSTEPHPDQENTFPTIEQSLQDIRGTEQFPTLDQSLEMIHEQGSYPTLEESLEKIHQEQLEKQRHAQELQNGHVSNGHTPGSVDDHFAYFRAIYNRANEYYLVQKVKDSYDVTKHTFPFLERALNAVESQVSEAAQVAAPVYENYCYPATDRLFNAYNKGVETSKTAVTRTKSAAYTTGAFSVGLAIVATQVSLIAGVAATNLVLDGVIATKSASGFVVGKGKELEKAVEERLYSTLATTQQIAKVPVEKLNDHANTFLDVANAVFERLLGLPNDDIENPESTLGQRVSRLASRVTRALTTKAHDDVIEPLQRQIHPLVDQLSKSLVLLDIVKERRQWAFDKVDRVSTSVQELRAKIEEEAKSINVAPEDMLLRFIRRGAGKLNENVKKLREKSQSVLGEPVNARIESAATYLEQLDETFTDAENLYQVNAEAFDEAKQKLHDIAQWSSSLIVRNGQPPKEQEASH